MHFLDATTGTGTLRTRLLVAAAGSDPLVVVNGPDGNLLKKVLPREWATTSPAHPTGVLFRLSALSLVLGRMAVMPADGDLSALPLQTWRPGWTSPRPSTAFCFRPLRMA